MRKVSRNNYISVVQFQSGLSFHQKNLPEGHRRMILCLLTLYRSHAGSGLCSKQERGGLSGHDPLHHEALSSQRSQHRYSLPLQPHSEELCHCCHLWVKWQPVSCLNQGPHQHYWAAQMFGVKFHPM